MSPKPLVAVWRDAIRDDPDLSTTATSVGWCLATYLNSRTGFGWPSVVLLAAGSKWSARTAGRAVNELEAKGYLEIDRSKGRSSHRYTAILPPTANELRRREWVNAEPGARNSEPDAPNRERGSHEVVENYELEAFHEIRDWCPFCNEQTEQRRQGFDVLCLKCSTRVAG